MKINNFVFDTNCIISSILIPLCKSQQAIAKAEKYGVLIFSEETFTELKEVLIRSKFDKYLPTSTRKLFITKLEAEGKFVPVVSNFTDCRDAKDNKFLDLAYDSAALFIITGDSDLLVLDPFQNIRIVTPAEFLNIHFSNLK